MVLQHELPWVTEIVMPLLPEVFFLEQSVLFAFVHPIYRGGFDKLIYTNGCMALIYNILEVHWKTGAYNKNGATSPPPPQIYSYF